MNTKMLEGWRKVIVAFGMIVLTGLFVKFTPEADPALFGNVVQTIAIYFFGANAVEHLSGGKAGEMIKGLFGGSESGKTENKEKEISS